MLTWRTAKGVADHFKAIDPNSAISTWFVRQLINNGDVPHISNGNRKLVAVEHIEAYLEQLGGGAIVRQEEH